AMWCRRNSGPPHADVTEAMEVVDTQGNWRPRGPGGPLPGSAVPRSPLPTRCQVVKAERSPLMGQLGRPPGSPQPIRSQPVSLMSSPLLQRGAMGHGHGAMGHGSPMGSPLPARSCHARGCQSASSSPLPLRHARAAASALALPASATASPARSLRSVASAASSRGASDSDLTDLGEDCSEAADLSSAAGEGVAETIVDGSCKFRDNKR
ncbi:Microtubule-actin cross-linking factor 1, partial [Frankliniella fusca]